MSAFRRREGEGEDRNTASSPSNPPPPSFPTSSSSSASFFTTSRFYTSVHLTPPPIIHASEDGRGGEYLSPNNFSNPLSPSNPPMNQHRLPMPIPTNPSIPSIPIKSILPSFLIDISPHIHIPPILSPPPRIPGLRIQRQKRIARGIRRVIQFQRVRRPDVPIFATVARGGRWLRVRV